MPLHEELGDGHAGGLTVFERLLKQSRAADVAGMAALGAIGEHLELAEAGLPDPGSSESVTLLDKPYLIADGRIAVSLTEHLITVDRVHLIPTVRGYRLLRYLGNPSGIDRPHNFSQILGKVPGQKNASKDLRIQIRTLIWCVDGLRKLIRDWCPEESQDLAHTKTGFVRRHQYGLLVVSSLAIPPVPGDY